MPARIPPSPVPANPRPGRRAPAALRSAPMPGPARAAPSFSSASILSSGARHAIDARLSSDAGGKSRLVCPSDIAYGDNGHPPTIPGGATLIFEVELMSIQDKSAEKK